MIGQEILITEYGNNKRNAYKLLEEESNLARGSVQKKHINGHDYFYLTFRENGKVVTTFIKSEDLDRTIEETMHRRGIEISLRQLRKEIKFIESSLGRFEVNLEHIKRSVLQVIRQHPEYYVERVTLFGSRATGDFRDDSDVDLMIKYYDGAPVTMLTVSALRLDLIDILGLDVDLINDPPSPGSHIEIGRTEVVYGE